MASMENLMHNAHGKIDEETQNAFYQKQQRNDGDYFDVSTKPALISISPHTDYHNLQQSYIGTLYTCFCAFHTPPNVEIVKCNCFFSNVIPQQHQPYNCKNHPQYMASQEDYFFHYPCQSNHTPHASNFMQPRRPSICIGEKSSSSSRRACSLLPDIVITPDGPSHVNLEHNETERPIKKNDFATDGIDTNENIYNHQEVEDNSKICECSRDSFYAISNSFEFSEKCLPRNVQQLAKHDYFCNVQKTSPNMKTKLDILPENVQKEEISKAENVSFVYSNHKTVPKKTDIGKCEKNEYLIRDSFNTLYKEEKETKNNLPNRIGSYKNAPIVEIGELKDSSYTSQVASEIDTDVEDDVENYSSQSSIKEFESFSSTNTKTENGSTITENAFMNKKTKKFNEDKNLITRKEPIYKKFKNLCHEMKMLENSLENEVYEEVTEKEHNQLHGSNYDNIGMNLNMEYKNESNLISSIHKDNSSGQILVDKVYEHRNSVDEAFNNQRVLFSQVSDDLNEEDCWPGELQVIKDSVVVIHPLIDIKPQGQSSKITQEKESCSEQPEVIDISLEIKHRNQHSSRNIKKHEVKKSEPETKGYGLKPDNSVSSKRKINSFDKNNWEVSSKSNEVAGNVNNAYPTVLDGNKTPTNLKPILKNELEGETELKCKEPESKLLSNGIFDSYIANKNHKVTVRDRVSAFENCSFNKLDIKMQPFNSKSLSLQNNVSQRSESEFEENDSRINKNRQLSETDTESESFAGLRKMTHYQRAATHSRLFKLLCEENDCSNNCKVFNNETQFVRRRIIHNVSITRKLNPNAHAEGKISRRERLSLPLHNNNSIDADNPSTPNSPVSSISSQITLAN